MRSLLPLNRCQLKYLVIVAMALDHIAWLFFPTTTLLGQSFHFVGRLTGPTMAFFVAEGYRYTKNVGRYAARLGIFAMLSYPAFTFFEYGCLPVYQAAGGVYFLPAFGVIYTLFLGLLAIVFWERVQNPLLKAAGVLVLCYLSQWGDWPIFDVLFCLLFHIWHDKPLPKWLCYGAICCIVVSQSFGSVWWSGLYSFGVFLVIPLLQFCYNGKKGSGSPFHKWFFYVFYPAHLVLLRLAAMAIG